MHTPAQSEPLTSYQSWMAKEGIPLVQGYSVDVEEVVLGPWPRLGGEGAYVHLHGQEGFTGMYICRIAPGQALQPERHLYEEIVYILRGQGSLELWWPGSSPQRVEWQAGSLFSPPLNTWHRLHNTGNDPVLFMAVTNAPLMMDLFHDEAFVFQCEHRFPSRYEGQRDYFAGPGRRYLGGPHGWAWEINFIPDVRTADLDPLGQKGAGVYITQYEMAGNVLVGHLAEWPVGHYHKAHYHEGGATLLILNSHGYTLLWPNTLGPRPYAAGHGAKVVKIDWRPGSVLSPPTGWFHQHFNLGREPARQLAFRYGSYKYPFGISSSARGGSIEGVFASVSQGGTLIEYEEEDPHIRRLYEELLSQEGLTIQMV